MSSDRSPCWGSHRGSSIMVSVGGVPKPKGSGSSVVPGAVARLRSAGVICSKPKGETLNRGTFFARTVSYPVTLLENAQMSQSVTTVVFLGKAGHRAKDCTAPPLPPGTLRLCKNCYKQGHIAAECTNDKACNNCRKTGHLARDCPNEPTCNLCNVSGHVARQYPKSNVLGDNMGGVRSSGYRSDVICRNCQQPGHLSSDCMDPLMMCHNCGSRGHLAYECPSGRFMDRFARRYG